jgi:hypothetical protein
MGMTDRDKKLLAIFALVIVLGGYWFLVLGSKRSAVKSAEDAKTSAQAELDTAVAAETQGKAEKKHYPIKYSRVLRMGKAIPVDSDFASLLVQVNDISDENGADFMSLTTTDGAASAAGSGATGTTTCDVAVSGGGGATGASSTTGASGATGAVTPAPAQSSVGKTINKAKAGEATGSNDANRAGSSDASFAAKCASSPSITDLTAVSSGLQLYTYSFTFDGSFFNLHKVFGALLGMVKAKNGHVSVTGRLLQINSIDLSVKAFPRLEATVDMTGYSLPIGTTITAGATASGPAGAGGAASVSSTPAPGAGTAAPPAASILGGK